MYTLSNWKLTKQVYQIFNATKINNQIHNAITATKVLKKFFEKHKGNTRVYFLAGQRAVDEFLDRDSVLDELCKILTTGADEAVKSLNSLKSVFNRGSLSIFLQSAQEGIIFIPQFLRQLFFKTAEEPVYSL